MLTRRWGSFLKSVCTEPGQPENPTRECSFSVERDEDEAFARLASTEPRPVVGLTIDEVNGILNGGNESEGEKEAEARISSHCPIE